LVLDSDPSLPPDTTRHMTLKVRIGWFDDELADNKNSWLTDRPFTVEIEVFGDLILDCHGQAVDANARTRVLTNPPEGHSPLLATPSGNGTPGGTFLSTFSVDAKPRVAGDDAV